MFIFIVKMQTKHGYYFILIPPLSVGCNYVAVHFELQFLFYFTAAHTSTFLEWIFFYSNSKSQSIHRFCPFKSFKQAGQFVYDIVFFCTFS